MIWKLSSFGNSPQSFQIMEQFLEDTTNKQILANRWKLEERDRKAFEKELGWSRFSKEETTRVALGEILSLDTPYPWGPGDLNTLGAHTVMTHSSTRVSTLRMSTDFSPSDIKMETSTVTGRIRTGGIHTADAFLWMAEGPDASTLLEEWAKNILRQIDAGRCRGPVHD